MVVKASALKAMKRALEISEEDLQHYKMLYNNMYSNYENMRKQLFDEQKRNKNLKSYLKALVKMINLKTS